MELKFYQCEKCRKVLITTDELALDGWKELIAGTTEWGEGKAHSRRRGFGEYGGGQRGKRHSSHERGTPDRMGRGGNGEGICGAVFLFDG